MRTIILQEPGRFELTATRPPEAPRDGEALVRVRRIGICGTDLHAYRGRQPFFSYPRILGHELGVEVVEVGPNARGIGPGDRCAVEPYLHCGACSACRRGRTNCCSRLQVLGVHCDGGMREYLTVPVAKLHPSASLPLEALALVEMLCIGAHAVRRAGLTPGEPALVIGAGPIGLSVIRFAQLAGAEVLVQEVSPHRTAFCTRHLGVTRTVDARADPLPQVRTLLDGDLPTAVFDATGSARSMHDAFRYVEHGGRLVLVGLFQGDLAFHDPEFHRREMTLLSSRNATAEDFAFVIEALERGAVDVGPWISQRVPFEGLIDAFSGWLAPERALVKAMVDLA